MRLRRLFFKPLLVTAIAKNSLCPFFPDGDCPVRVEELASTLRAHIASVAWATRLLPLDGFARSVAYNENDQ